MQNCRCGAKTQRISTRCTQHSIFAEFRTRLPSDAMQGMLQKVFRASIAYYSSHLGRMQPRGRDTRLDKSPYPTKVVGAVFKTADAGWSSSVARWAHNPEVQGSNPCPATSAAASTRKNAAAFSISSKVHAVRPEIFWDNVG